MKLLFFGLFLLLAFCAEAATPYTEFYCNSTGTNINAGSTTNATPTYSTTGGDWVASTGVFTKTGANLSAVTVGMWASVFIDGATTAVFVGRITAVDDTADTITVSTTIKTGTAPADGTGTRSINVEGAWYGPWYSGATVDNLPFSFVNDRLTNIAQASPRINLKNDRIYTVTNCFQQSNGPIAFYGFATNAGDLGKTWITGSTVGAGHIVLQAFAANASFAYFIFATNGASGTSALVNNGEVEHTFRQCVFRDSRGNGLSCGNYMARVDECEAFLCNAGNVLNSAGFSTGSGAGTVFNRCVSHDNSGTGNCGFYAGSFAVFIGCIADSNGRNGLMIDSTTGATIIGCNFYNNATNGIDLTTASAIPITIENCNFIGNGVGLTGANAINSSGSLLRHGSVVNCVFGTGTATNGSGGANIFTGTGLDEIGSIGLAANVTPWVDPANGNFSVTNTSPTINAGRGVFTQTQSGYGGTVSYPDIGATQITNTSSSSGFVSYPIFRR